MGTCLVCSEGWHTSVTAIPSVLPWSPTPSPYRLVGHRHVHSSSCGSRFPYSSGGRQVHSLDCWSRCPHSWRIRWKPSSSRLRHTLPGVSPFSFGQSREPVGLTGVPLCSPGWGSKGRPLVRSFLFHVLHSLGCERGRGGRWVGPASGLGYHLIARTLFGVASRCGYEGRGPTVSGGHYCGPRSLPGFE